MVRGRSSRSALQLNHLAGAARLLDQPLGGELGFVIGIGTDVAFVKRLVFGLNRAIENQHRHSRLLGLFQNVVPSGLDDRREDDRIDALKKQRADPLNLILLLALAVDEFQLVATFLRFFDDRIRVGLAPIRRGAALDEADHRFFVSAVGAVV